MADPERAWQVTGLHHVEFAHDGGDTPGVLGDLPGLRCGHSESADGFVERMLPAGNAYLQLPEATGPGVLERFLRRRGPALHLVACGGLLVELVESSPAGLTGTRDLSAGRS